MHTIINGVVYEIRTATCAQCGIAYRIRATEAQWRQWEAGQPIQNAMPHLSVNEREILISGYCGRCYDKLFETGEA